VGEVDGTVRIWNTTGGTLHHTFAGNWLNRVNAIQSDGTKVVTACQDKLLRVYDLRNNRYVQDLADHTEAVHQVQFDGHKVVSGGADHCMKVWDIKNGKRLYSLLGGTLQQRSNDPPHPNLPGCSGLMFDEGRIVGAFKSLLRVYSFTGEDVNQGS